MSHLPLAGKRRAMEGSCLLLSSSHHKNRVPSAGIPIIWTSQAGVGEIVAGQLCFPGRCIICWVTQPPPLHSSLSWESLAPANCPEGCGWAAPDPQGMTALHQGILFQLGCWWSPFKAGVSPETDPVTRNCGQLISEAVPENILWNWGRETGNGSSQ